MVGGETRHMGRPAVARRVLALAPILAILLSACGTDSTQSLVLPVLHLPGVSEVTALAGVKTYTSGGWIRAIAPYDSPNVSDEQHVIVMEDNGLLFDASLHTNDLRRLISPWCSGELSVSGDGNRRVCSNDGGLVMLFAPGQKIADLDTSAEVPGKISGIALSLDGSLLAVASSCDVDVFTLTTSAPFTHWRAVFDLSNAIGASQNDRCTFPGGPYGLGGLYGLSWSGDGAWLSFNSQRTGGIDLYALHIGPLLSDMSASAPTSPPLLVQSSDLVRVDTTPPETSATWRMVGATPKLTYLSDQQTITEVDPVSLQRKVLLRVSGAPLQALAWIPDGSSLLFVQTQWFCEDCSGLPFPLSRLYIFQPSTS